MMKKLLFPFCFVAVFSIVTGCGGGGGPAEFDPSTADPYTAEDEKAAEDYEAQRLKEMKEQS
ncbi:hypothetical protein [Neorhodopirellula pilleata]|uniref:Secreted protein n=1 Tax=Neorhodopirellula pilleata TaxID=2714738 RepID=A0A5C6AUP6_9BACT|nr:hypothetical protein [Neorhodopirellula pilleata]TWU03308.1 hypothetical protein Pla100_02260 [Neorhodopirellula pilleata]